MKQRDNSTTNSTNKQPVRKHRRKNKNNMEEKKKQERKKRSNEGAAQTKVTFKLDNGLLAWLKSKANKGRYINNLIRADAKKAWVDPDEALEKRGDFEEV